MFPAMFPTMTTPRPLALVTGASSGIGKAYAEALARRGYDLLLVARDAGRLEALATALATCAGVTVTPLSADLASEDGLAAVEQAIATAGRLDLLVNNAGFGTRGTLLGASPEGQATMLALHVVAVHRLTRAALALMVPAGRGAVVTVASVASFVNSAGNVNYCATKAYQRSFMEGLALEVAHTGVRCQALCPGFTRTEFHQRMSDDQQGRAPAWLWLSAGAVVEASLRQLESGGPVICIPGWQYKGIVFLARHLPLWLKARLTGPVYRRDR